MDPKFSITKSKVECYKIRHTSGMYWADITIDSNGTTGRIQVASDYGDWQNYWGACGCLFKQFLTEIDMHYTAGKFGESKWFDEQKTIQVYKQTIIEWRRNDDIDAERAREMWTEISNLNSSDETAFAYQVMGDCPSFYQYSETPEMYHSVSPQFRSFWKNVWPVFINLIKQEILETAC